MQKVILKTCLNKLQKRQKKNCVQMIILRLSDVKNLIHRENYASRNPEAYYRKSIFIPFLDHYLNQLSSRFLNFRKHYF